MLIVEINWFPTKKVSKVASQTSFLCIHAFMHNRKSISLGIQSDRFISPALLLKLQK